MDKTFLKRGMASALSLVMAFSTAVPSSLVYAEETGIVSEIAQDLTATLNQTENGKVSFVSDGNKTQEPTMHGPGDKVEIAVEPEEGFNAVKIEVKNADGAVVASLDGGQVTGENGIYNFEMPESNVTVDVAFEAAPAAEEPETETAPETESEKETEEVTETDKKEAEETKIQIFEEFNKDSLVSKEVVDQYDFSCIYT